MNQGFFYSAISFVVSKLAVLDVAVLVQFPGVPVHSPQLPLRNIVDGCWQLCLCVIGYWLDRNHFLTLKNLDPFQHFGMFAEGYSQEGFRVYLTMNIRNSVDLNIQTPNNSGFTAVELAKGGPTRIHTGISVHRASGNEFEWLSCKLEVQ